jgi:hypothetical protein
MIGRAKIAKSSAGDARKLDGAEIGSSGSVEVERKEPKHTLFNLRQTVPLIQGVLSGEVNNQFVSHVEEALAAVPEHLRRDLAGCGSSVVVKPENFRVRFDDLPDGTLEISQTYKVMERVPVRRRSVAEHLGMDGIRAVTQIAGAAGKTSPAAGLAALGVLSEPMGRSHEMRSRDVDLLQTPELISRDLYDRVAYRFNQLRKKPEDCFGSYSDSKAFLRAVERDLRALGKEHAHSERYEQYNDFGKSSFRDTTFSRIFVELLGAGGEAEEQWQKAVEEFPRAAAVVRKEFEIG